MKHPISMPEAIKLVLENQENLDTKYEITDFSLDGLEVLEESRYCTIYAYDEDTLTSIMEVRRNSKRLFFVCEGEDCDEVGELLQIPYKISELPTYRLIGEITGMTDAVIELNHSLNCDIVNGIIPEPDTEAMIEPFDSNGIKGIYAVQEAEYGNTYIALAAESQYPLSQLSRNTLEELLKRLQSKASQLTKQLNPDRDYNCD